MLTYLADVLRTTGYKVVEEGDWEHRGKDQFYEARGTLWHHTAGGSSTHSSLNVLINGREGLPGPLCNVYVCREPAFHVISARKANHAGEGGEGQSWIPDDQGNNYLIGFECENTGTGESWNALYPIMVAGAAAIHEHLGLDVARCIDHKEYTSRKPDRAGLSPSTFRADVAERMSGGDDELASSDEILSEITGLRSEEAGRYDVYTGRYQDLSNVARDTNADLGGFRSEESGRYTTYTGRYTEVNDRLKRLEADAGTLPGATGKAGTPQAAEASAAGARSPSGSSLRRVSF